MNVLILIIVLISLIRSYQSTIVAMAPLMVFFSMLTIPFVNLTTISLGDLLVMIAVILYPLNFSLNDAKKYPFHICTLLMAIAFFGSNFFGYERHIFLSVAKILTIYVYPVILWVCLNGSKQFRIFEISMLIFSILLIVYAFFEAFTFSNYLLEFLNKGNQLMDTVMITYQYRFGVKRLQSFLPLFDAFGYTVGSFGLIMIYLKLFVRKTLVRPDYVTILIIALFVGVLLTGTRAVILAVVVGSLMFYKIFKKYLIPFIVALVMMCIIASSIPFFENLIKSFFDTQSVGGSNSDMRVDQLMISLYYFFQSPIWGNGPTYTFTVARQLDEGLLGAESVWFVYLIDYGAIGCFILLFTMIYPIAYLIKNKMTSFIFIVLMFFVDKTLSSAPGISDGYFFIYIIFLMRREKFESINRFVKNCQRFDYGKIVNNNSSL